MNVSQGDRALAEDFFIPESNKGGSDHSDPGKFYADSYGTRLAGGSGDTAWKSRWNDLFKDGTGDFVEPPVRDKPQGGQSILPPAWRFSTGGQKPQGYYQERPSYFRPDRPRFTVDRVPEGDRVNETRDKPLAGKKIYIDAGHGANHPKYGAVHEGVEEKNLVLDYALELGRKLQSMGAEVVQTRTSDVLVTNQQRQTRADASHADIVLRIHANSSKSSSVNGIETYYTDPHDRPLADAVHGSLVSELNQYVGTHGGGRVQDRNVLHRQFEMDAQAPQILMELGYMSNHRELSRLTSPGYRTAAVDAIADGVVKYFNSR
ncbi:MAG: N-acetylmuramoyl-L-alanine amidase [Candidatus Obscuribacterales bacterium]